MEHSYKYFTIEIKTIMKQLFWKAFYRLKFGSNYSNVMKSINSLGRYLDDAASGDFSVRYNSNGEQIRGWHKKSPSFKFAKEHPLVVKYRS
jgi:hypothetical protein